MKERGLSTILQFKANLCKGQSRLVGRMFGINPAKGAASTTRPAINCSSTMQRVLQIKKKYFYEWTNSALHYAAMK